MNCALNLLRSKSDSPRISLGEAIDELIGGGAFAEDCIELYGATGSGKTNLAVQCAVNVGVPAYFGGLDGGCLFVDCDCSFVPERARQMALATAASLRALYDDQIMKLKQQQRQQQQREQRQKSNDTNTLLSNNSNDNTNPVNNANNNDYNNDNNDDNIDENSTSAPMSAEQLLANIRVYRPHSYVELTALIHSLPHLARKFNAKLVVIDGIAALFRGEVDLSNDSKRVQLLANIANRLVAMAHADKLVVLTTNHLTITASV